MSNKKRTKTLKLLREDTRDVLIQILEDLPYQVALFEGQDIALIDMIRELQEVSVQKGQYSRLFRNLSNK
jgi:hypothetical protein